MKRTADNGGSNWGCSVPIPSTTSQIGRAIDISNESDQPITLTWGVDSFDFDKDDKEEFRKPCLVWEIESRGGSGLQRRYVDALRGGQLVVSGTRIMAALRWDPNPIWTRYDSATTQSMIYYPSIWDTNILLPLNPSGSCSIFAHEGTGNNQATYTQRSPYPTYTDGERNQLRVGFVVPNGARKGIVNVNGSSDGALYEWDSTVKPGETLTAIRVLRVWTQTQLYTMSQYSVPIFPVGNVLYSHNVLNKVLEIQWVM